MIISPFPLFLWTSAFFSPTRFLSSGLASSFTEKIEAIRRTSLSSPCHIHRLLLSLLTGSAFSPGLWTKDPHCFKHHIFSSTRECPSGNSRLELQFSLFYRSFPLAWGSLSHLKSPLLTAGDSLAAPHFSVSFSIQLLEGAVCTSLQFPPSLWSSFWSDCCSHNSTETVLIKN